MSALGFLLQKFDFDIGKIHISVPYIQAAAIVILIFVLILTLAQVRRHFFDWSAKGALFGIFFGFLLALILEGFLLVGGRTAITEILGWKNAPKPIANALDVGKAKLVDVLGMETQIPSTSAKTDITAKEVINIFQSLNPSEAQKAKKIICQ